MWTAVSRHHCVQRDELCDVLSDYFEQSEQLATKFWLSTGDGAAVALMLQQLPKQLVPDETVRFDQWQTLCALADTVTTDELLTIDTDRLLYRLFNEWTVKRLNQKASDSSATARASEAQRHPLIPEHEITELFEEQETVTMNCEM